IVHASPRPADGPGAKGDLGDIKPSAAEGAVVHGQSIRRTGRTAAMARRLRSTRTRQRLTETRAFRQTGWRSTVKSCSLVAGAAHRHGDQRAMPSAARRGPGYHPRESWMMQALDYERPIHPPPSRALRFFAIGTAAYPLLLLGALYGQWL